MSAESIIQNCKKIFVDEMSSFCQNDEAEKAFDEFFEKLRNLDFSEVQDEKEAIDNLSEIGITPELMAYFKKTTLSMTRPFHLKNASEMECVLAKSFVVLNKSSTKVR